MVVAPQPVSWLPDEFKAAAESLAAPCDSFISELRSNCESELGRYGLVDLGQVMEPETEQTDAFRQGVKRRQQGLSRAREGLLIRHVRREALRPRNDGEIAELD